VHKEFALKELSEEELQLLVVIFDVFKILLNFVKPHRGVLLPKFAVSVLLLQISELVVKYLHLLPLVVLVPMLCVASQPDLAVIALHPIVKEASFGDLQFHIRRIVQLAMIRSK